jgi:hypothetical protein
MFGQAGTLGTMTGVVTDPSGAVVPDATVSITEKATHAVQNQTTNSAGRYTFVNLRPGDYEVTITKSGFAKVTIPSDIIEVGETSTNNVTMKVGSENQTVEVESSGVELQTLNATVGSTVTGLALDSLPSIQRDTSTFLTLQAGISPDGSVAGAVVDQSSFQLDGGENTNDMDGSMSVYTPSYAGDPTGGVANQSNGVAAGATGVMPTPADSVQEFKVNIAGQGADFNSSAGAQVIVQTRSGTDQWHGTAYEYYLDNSLSANTWNNNFDGIGAPLFHYNRFGGSIGGPVIPKKILGGKTYIFANYEGFRYPNSTTITRAVPSAAMRLGLLQFKDVNGNLAVYNLNPMSITTNVVTGATATYAPAICSGSANGICDPLGIGLNSMVASLWNTHMPPSNTNSCGRCDGHNVLGFTANIALPQTSNFAVAKIDHNFGDKWKFFTSYRYYNLQAATTQQVDIGGLAPGDTNGQPKSLSNNPQQPWYLVAGLDANLSNTWTNSIRYSFLRNWWQWGRYGGVVQVPGLGGALELGGETATNALQPYNVNTQQTRTRFWDGQDNMIRDDATWIHGRHMVQFGGMYQHNFNWHSRTDNGGGINYYPVYQIGAGLANNNLNNMGTYTPDTFAGSTTTYNRDYAEVLGMVSISQIAYTRTGANLTLNPPLTPAFDKVTIPYWNFYGGDTWRINPRLTLNYGLGWTLELPPTEANGKQVIFVDSTGHPVSTTQYMNARQASALAGQVYNPIVGFSLIGNVAGHPKYPYNPFYGEWSPRVSAAWDVGGDGRTVVRGGYGRSYGRLNGVDLVLVPLLGTGLIQATQCTTVLATGVCGSGGADPTNVFRVGPNGNGLVAPMLQATQTLPQPLYPGVNGVAAGAGEALDPNFRPNVVNTFTLTIARQLNNKMSVEFGYIGRTINHEYAPVNLNAVPYMMTLGGQQFQKAYANLVFQYCGGIAGLAGSGCNVSQAIVNAPGKAGINGGASAITPQPFFEAALAGTGYCNGYASCTAAVADQEGIGVNLNKLGVPVLDNSGAGNLNQQFVTGLWDDLDQGGSAPGFNFSRSMMNTPLAGAFGAHGQLTSGVGMNTSLGYGNYNALFITFKTQAWHGLTMQSNFTWSKALGTGAEVQATSADTLPDPFNLRTGYGYQAYDRRFIYNLYMVYQPNLYKSQSGFLGHLAGGWTIAPVFTAGSGLPITVGTLGQGLAFGEGDLAGNFVGYGNSENAIPITPNYCSNNSSANYNVAGSNGIATGASYPVNMYRNPEAAWNNFRQPVLGYDTHDGGFGICRGLPYWNMDLSVKKNVKITERLNAEFQVVFTNVFNHNQWGDTCSQFGCDFLDTTSPSTWGGLPGTVTGTTPRAMQFGIRLSF